MTHSPMVFAFLIIFAVLWEDFSLHDQQIWLHEWIHRWMDGPCNKIVDPFRASYHTSTHIQSNFIYCISIGTWPAWCNQSSDKSKIQNVSLVVQNSVLTNTSRMRFFTFTVFTLISLLFPCQFQMMFTWNKADSGYYNWLSRNLKHFKCHKLWYQNSHDILPGSILFFSNNLVFQNEEIFVWWDELNKSLVHELRSI